MRVQVPLFLLVIWAIAVATAIASKHDLDAAKSRADKAYEAQDWGAAAKGYFRIVEDEASNGRAWYRLGVSLRRLGKPDEAKTALEQALSAGLSPQIVRLEIAKILVEKRETEAALDTLEQLAEGGLTNVDGIANDDAFESLEKKPRFEAVVQRVRRNARPCDEGPFREFDFWIGDWDVVDADGAHQGTNRITLGPGGCMLEENWTGASGSAGTSLNYYDPVDGKWRQLWVSSGLLIEIEGGLKAGAMHLAGTSYYVARGDQRAFRGTWTPLPDGRVRQLFEESTDDGETWSTWFDGYYTRKPEKTD